MTKKEQAEMESLREQLRIAKSFRFTEKVEPDVIPPTYGQTLTRGWTFNDYTGEVVKGCSSSVHHGYEQDEKTTEQGPLWLYSSKALALKAARNCIERKFAKELANIDALIEQELGQ